MSQDDGPVTIKIGKSAFWQFTIVLFAALFIISVVWTNGFGFAEDGGTSATTGYGTAPATLSTPQPSPKAPPARAPTQIQLDDNDPHRGYTDTSVVIVEFSDFQCPFCKKFHDQTESQLIKEYVDTGKAVFYYKDFPMTQIHPQAQSAAEAAECANQQGKFWEYHYITFQNQGSLSPANYKKWAGDLGLNQGEFDSCVDSGQTASTVNGDLATGRSAGVTGTPTFFINGQRIVGAQSFAAFQAVIEQELA